MEQQSATVTTQKTGVVMEKSKGGKREGAGPKPRAGVNAKNRSIKFTDQEWLIVKQEAKKVKLTASDYVRSNLHLTVICSTCKTPLSPSEIIYDKLAEQNYCPHCGWPTEEDHSE